MDVRHEVTDGVALCRIAGKIDALTGPSLQAAAASAINAGNSKIIFDMREVAYISSAGLRVIAAPQPQYPPDPDALAAASLVLPSLAELTTDAVAALS